MEKFLDSTNDPRDSQHSTRLVSARELEDEETSPMECDQRTSPLPKPIPNVNMMSSCQKQAKKSRSNSAKPSTELMIRLLSGEQIKHAFNTDQTVADVRAFVKLG